MSYIPVPPPPGFTPDQQQKIIEALSGKLRPCSSCGKMRSYQLFTEGMVYMPVTPPLGYSGSFGRLNYGSSLPMYQGRGLPCIAIICQNCGHLQFHSVIQLGLGAVLGVLPDAPTFGGL
jgi:hypothetical protein